MSVTRDTVEQISQQLNGRESDAPVVVKQAALQFWQQELDGRVGVHADDALTSTQRRVSHIL